MLDRRASIRSPLCSRSAGFTLIELIIVMVMIGALATFAMPRMVDTQQWRLRSFGDDLQGQLQAMLRQSLAQRREIVATLTDTGVSFAYAGGSSLGTLSCPAAASPCMAEAGPRTVSFNKSNSGSSITSTHAALIITVSHGDYSQAYRLENETGLIHPTP